MTIKDKREGWWGIPPADEWICPECGVSSPTEAWVECSPACEDCGSHDGRECPNCGEQFDHVFGVERISAVRGNGVHEAERS